MTPVAIGLLVIGSGLVALLFLHEGKPQKTTIIEGRKYKVWWNGEHEFRIVREYEGQDVISLTASKDRVQLYVSSALHADPALSARLRIEMARDMVDNWEKLGLPPKENFRLPGDVKPKPEEYGEYA